MRHPKLIINDDSHPKVFFYHIINYLQKGFFKEFHFWKKFQLLLWELASPVLVLSELSHRARLRYNVFECVHLHVSKNFVVRKKWMKVINKRTFPAELSRWVNDPGARQSKSWIVGCCLHITNNKLSEFRIEIWHIFFVQLLEFPSHWLFDRLRNESTMQLKLEVFGFICAP